MATADTTSGARRNVGSLTAEIAAGNEPESSGNDEEATEGESLTEEGLNAMTVAQLKALANERGITLTATKKADIIAEILAGTA